MLWTGVSPHASQGHLFAGKKKKKKKMSGASGVLEPTLRTVGGS